MGYSASRAVFCEPAAVVLKNFHTLLLNSLHLRISYLRNIVSSHSEYKEQGWWPSQSLSLLWTRCTISISWANVQHCGNSFPTSAVSSCLLCVSMQMFPVFKLPSSRPVNMLPFTSIISLTSFNQLWHLEVIQGYSIITFTWLYMWCDIIIHALLII